MKVIVPSSGQSVKSRRGVTQNFDTRKTDSAVVVVVSGKIVFQRDGSIKGPA